MEDNFTPKKPLIFFCEKCNFKSSNKKDYTRHLMTRKHKKDTKEDKNDDFWDPENPKPFICECGNQYKLRQGLWKHKKTCMNKSINPSSGIDNETDIKMLTNLVLEVVKQNNDLTTKIVDLCKTGQVTNSNTVIANNVISNNTNNTNNNTFNLNVFLNEKCKDAMNINEFVDSIQLDLADLESVGRLGYIEGISNIIVKNLKALDVTERPIHCADKKRDVIYIKDENKWEKEDEDKKRLRKVIKRITYKNEKLLPKYKEKYPDYTDYDSIRSDQYSKIVIEAMGGEGDNNHDKETKIMKKIAKEVVIDKSINCLD
jgi:hypothetical protein